MFLNNFNKRDENAGVNIKLKDVYMESHLPHYILKGNIIPFTDLKVLLAEFIYEKNYYNQMLLILGQPGIGKSTLITWIITNFAGKTNNKLLVYRFASDLKDINWQKERDNYNISHYIFKSLGLTDKDLEGYTLIIDGFDEISVGNDRARILNRLYWELRKYTFNNFLMIITCRENYIEKLDKVECDYIILQPWDSEQIRSFCKAYQEKTINSISEKTMANILENRSVLGIPLILYMVLALNISIEKEGSIVDIYDRIFALNGGIYDRCIIYNSHYNSYEEPHRIKKIKRQIHQISREIAIRMFENNPDEAFITQKEYQEICNLVMKEEKRMKIQSRIF